MKKKETKLFENIWITRIVSLLIALLLFGYVYSENYGLTTTNRNNAISTTRNETISNLPIEVNMDTDRYFISGLPETVALSLSGPESVIVQTLSAGDYRVVTEDLDVLGPGRHTIQLKVENVSDDLSYQLTPSRVNVEIEEKETIESPVEVLFNASAVEEEYIAGEPKLSTDTVLITGPASTIERIDRIYVRVSADSLLTDDLNVDTAVQVEDSNKNKLNVSIEPQQVSVQIPIKPYEKTVPLKVEQKGTPESGKTYEFSILDTEEVTLKGNRNLLAAIEEAKIEVDVTGIKADTIVTVPVQLSIPTSSISPEQIKVNVKVKTDKSSTDTTNEETPGKVTDENNSEAAEKTNSNIRINTTKKPGSVN